MLHRAIFCIVVALFPAIAIAATPQDQARLRSDFAKISFGYAIDQICDVTSHAEKISFMADYVDANWWMWRARTGVNKTIAKKMGEKAWRQTSGGTKCDQAATSSVKSAMEMIAQFPTEAEALFGAPTKSLLNPKPDQKRIFATYQAARLAWIMDAKCNSEKSYNSALFLRLMKARKQLLIVFRPDQLGGLEKSTNQMKMWATLGQCTAKRKSFVLYMSNALAELETFSMPQILTDLALATADQPPEKIGN